MTRMRSISLVLIVHHAVHGRGKELSKAPQMAVTKLYSDLLTFYYFPIRFVFLSVYAKVPGSCTKLSRGPGLKESRAYEINSFSFPGRRAGSVVGNCDRQ